jgi:hypothetical protein
MKERLDDLIQKYGPFGAVSYLRQYDNGSGDYTKEREKLLEGITMDDIKREIAALPKKEAEPIEILEPTAPMIASVLHA